MISENFNTPWELGYQAPVEEVSRPVELPISRDLSDTTFLIPGEPLIAGSQAVDTEKKSHCFRSGFVASVTGYASFLVVWPGLEAVGFDRNPALIGGALVGATVAAPLYVKRWLP